MSVITASRLVRKAVEQQFASLFNQALYAAWNEFGIPESLYTINFTDDPGQPQNFYRESWALEDLAAYRLPVLPALCLWTGEGGEFAPGERSMPRTFSGWIRVHWRFFLLLAQSSTGDGLTELREATEAAMLASLAPEFTAITYRGDLAWGEMPPRDWKDFDPSQLGFVQEIEYTASFRIEV